MIWEALNANDIIRHRLQFVSDDASYVSGGTTFIYPFTFDNTPIISVSLQLGTALFDPQTTYSAIVTDNLTGSCTVRVTKAVDTGVGITDITEASNDEVIVTIFTVEDPF
jgi:hypothetical protein